MLRLYPITKLLRKEIAGLKTGQVFNRIFESYDNSTNGENSFKPYHMVAIQSKKSFPHSLLMTAFLRRVTRRVPPVVQDLLTLPENLSSPTFC